MTTKAEPEEAAPAAPEIEKKEDAKMDNGKKEVEEKKDDPKEAEVLKSVAERLKFFFSNANVRQDFFLRKFLLGYEPEGNKDCSVPVEVLLRFNTIKQHTTDPDLIVKAVQEHLTEKLVVKDDGKAIARVEPFTKELVNDNIPLSLYVKNLPIKEETNHGRKQTVYDVSIGDIRKLFETYGEVALIKLRFKRSARSDGDEHHTDDIKMDAPKEGGGKKPRRRFPLECCMVEFENIEAHGKAAEDVLTIKEGEKVEAKRKLQLGEKTLEVMLLKEYVDTLRKRKRERDDDKEEIDDEAAKFTIEWKPGCVLSLKGLAEACDREAILDAVSAACELTNDEIKAKKIYADYSRGQTDGAVRFDEPETASKMLEKLKSGDAKICDAKVEEVSLLEGDAEKKYWDEFIQFKRKQIRHRNEERKHHKGRNKRRKSDNRKNYETLQS